MESPYTRENVRQHPGMYVGDVHDGTGVAHMLWEVVSNAADQYLAGRCSRIEVVLHESFSATVRDDGPGIPPERIADALMRFHEEPTLDSHAPHVHLGRHGIGLFPIAALSSVFEIETRNAEKTHRWRLERGVPVTPITSRDDDRAPGTSIHFEPDPTLFAAKMFPREQIHRGLRDLADLTSGLEVNFRDERLVMRAPRGLFERIQRLAPDAIHVMSTTETVGDASVEVALGWLPWMQTPQYQGFANLCITRHGGTHVVGLREAVRGLGHTEAERDALESGVVAVVSVVLPDVKFGSPTTDKLVSSEAKPLVRAAAERMLAGYFDANPMALRDLSSDRADVRRRLARNPAPR